MKIFILAIIMAVICMVVKNYKPEYGLVCQLCACAVVVIYTLTTFVDVFKSVTEMFSFSGIDLSFVEVLFKALGISLLTDFAASICKDSANNTLSNCIELFGKTIIIFMAMPMLKRLAEVAIGFLK